MYFLRRAVTYALSTEIFLEPRPSFLLFSLQTQKSTSKRCFFLCLRRDLLRRAAPYALATASLFEPRPSLLLSSLQTQKSTSKRCFFLCLRRDSNPYLQNQIGRAHV